MKYFITTFGCAQNVSDTERIAAMLEARGMEKAHSISDAHHVVINTCMIREMAENRVYGAVYNLSKQKVKTGLPQKIVVTGCMVGMAVRDKTGKFLKLIRRRMPDVDEFLPIEEVGFDHAPVRTNAVHAWIPISNGCNNFCTFCVVPFTRGREISRSYEDILQECNSLVQSGYKKITLLGMNVNSYGADLIVGSRNMHVMRDIENTYFIKKNTPLNTMEYKGYRLPNGTVVQPVLVKHLNRLRIPTLFPYLLDDVCQINGIESVDFISSNPWDFSDELINVIAKNSKISRCIHLPVQSGSNAVLRRMNRWYTKRQYLKLIKKIRDKITNVHFSTDIIVGFCGETEKEFLETVDLVRNVGFDKAYIAMYSDRPMTAAHKAYADNILHKEKKRRWQILEDIINKPHFKKNDKLIEA